MSMLENVANEVPFGPKDLRWDLARLPQIFTNLANALVPELDANSLGQHCEGLQFKPPPIALLQLEPSELSQYFASSTTCKRYMTDPGWSSNLDENSAVQYAHCGSAADLIPTIVEGLKPIGSLNLAVRVPYGGELGPGIWQEAGFRAINIDRVSAVAIFNFHQARRYLSPDLIKPWTPDIGIQTLHSYERYIMEYYPSASIHDYPCAPSEAHKVQALQDRYESCARKFEILARRVLQWNQLSSIERALIADPFGVAYGFNDMNPAGLGCSGGLVDSEVLVAQVEPKDLILFVPRERMLLVQTILNALGRNTPLKALEGIEEMRNE